MRISVILAPDVAAEDELTGRSCVVIDVLRATTSMIAALDAGATAIYPVAEAEDAWALRAQMGEGLLLGGERGGLKINGFDLGNSPREYTAEAVGNSMLAMTTTNGTAAMLAAARAGASPIYIASLRNAPATARRLLREGRDAVLYCAGTNGRVSLDDIIAAGAIASVCEESRSRAALTDTGKLALAAYRLASRDVAAALTATIHGRRLVEIGFEQDIRYAAAVGASQTVAQFDGVMVRPAGHMLR
jgi:2-phosphosulfolactate phosphatase